MEEGRLTADPHLSLSSPPNPNPQSYPQLCSKPPFVASPPSIPPLPDHKDLNLLLHSLCYPSLQLQQALSRNTSTRPAREARKPAEQRGQFQTVTPTHFLHIQSPSPISSSVADYLLWLFLTLYLYPQMTKQTLVEHLALFLLVNPFRPTLFQPITIPKCLLPIPKNIYYSESPVTTPISILKILPIRQHTSSTSS